MSCIVKEDRDGKGVVVHRWIYVHVYNLSFFCAPHVKMALYNCCRCTISELNCKGSDCRWWSGRVNSKLPTIVEKAQRVSTFLACCVFALHMTLYFFPEFNRNIIEGRSRVINSTSTLLGFTSISGSR